MDDDELERLVRAFAEKQGINFDQLSLEGRRKLRLLLRMHGGALPPNDSEYANALIIPGISLPGVREVVSIGEPPDPGRPKGAAGGSSRGSGGSDGSDGSGGKGF